MDLFSSLLLGCLGTATMQASTIGPFGAEKPFGGRDGLGIGLCIVKTQSQNRQKRNAILDQKLKLIGRQVVQEFRIMIWNLSLTSKGFRSVLDFGSWSRAVARVWPNCCQLTLWLSLSSRWPLRSSCSKPVCQSKSFAGLRIYPWMMSCIILI